MHDGLMRTTIEISDDTLRTLRELAARRGEKGYSRIIEEGAWGLLRATSPEPGDSRTREERSALSKAASPRRKRRSGKAKNPRIEETLADALIDSDVLIDVLKMSGDTAAWLAEYGREHALFTSAVNVFEVARGFNSDRALEAGMSLLKEFLVLPLDSQAALEAASIDVELRRSGTPLDAGDLLIAGIARFNNLALITRNVRHFARIEGLEVAAPTVS